MIQEEDVEEQANNNLSVFQDDEVIIQNEQYTRDSREEEKIPDQ